MATSSSAPSSEVLATMINSELLKLANRSHATREPVIAQTSFEGAMARQRVAPDDVPIYSPALRSLFDELDLNVARTALANPWKGKERSWETAALRAAGLRFGSIGWSQVQQAYYYRVAAHPAVRRICEVGFNAGHSSALWLTANPTARVDTFDLFDRTTMAAMVANYELLRARFPGRLHSHRGDSLRSVPAAQLEEPCDLVHVDGKHDYPHAVLDTVHLMAKSRPSALYLFDDQCDAEGGCAGHNSYAAARPALATCDLVKAGLLEPVASMYHGDRQFALFRQGTAARRPHNRSRLGSAAAAPGLLPCARCALRYLGDPEHPTSEAKRAKMERDLSNEQHLFRGNQCREGRDAAAQE